VSRTGEGGRGQGAPVETTDGCLLSSGRQDSNPRPLGPEPSALAGLRHFGLISRLSPCHSEKNMGELLQICSSHPVL
jgi:hypothetical protein